jgi:hypothetical protein
VTHFVGANTFVVILQQDGNPVESHIHKGVCHSVTEDRGEIVIDIF